MNTIWLLLAISTGAYNGGTVTVVERFQSLQDCRVAMQAIDTSGMRVTAMCVQATNPVKTPTALKVIA
jgi:hypothetical protein